MGWWASEDSGGNEWELEMVGITVAVGAGARVAAGAGGSAVGS